MYTLQVCLRFLFHFTSHHSCTSRTIHWCHCIQWTVCCFLHQHVNEFSEGLVWASGEGCQEDVVFLLSTGVEVNSIDQVRLCNDQCSTCQTKVQLLSCICCIFTCGTCRPVTHVLPTKYNTIKVRDRFWWNTMVHMYCLRWYCVLVHCYCHISFMITVMYCCFCCFLSHTCRVGGLH